MIKRISMIATALVILLAGASLVMAQPPDDMGPGMGPGMRMGPGMGCGSGMLSALDLTPEQTEKIRSLRETLERDITPLKAQVFERKAEVRLLWLQTEADAEQIKAKEKEIHDLKWQIKEKFTDFRLAVRGELTPEQLTKLLAIGGERGFKGMRGYGRHGHHGKQGRGNCPWK